jgi:glycerophosphoryl diester phosphodiesterase
MTVRIVRTRPTKGPLRRATPIPLPEQAIIGHRGFGANRFTSTFLENSLPSYGAALHAGANAIQVDVQLTSDDVPVCSHDFEVEDHDSNCKETVRINTMSAKQFRKSGLCTPFETERPTLREVLGRVPDGAILDLELKFPTDQNSFPYTDRNHYIDRVIRECEERGQGRQIFFCTFDLMLAVMIGLRQKKYEVLLLASVQEDQPISLLVNMVRAITPLLKFARVAGFVFNSPNLMTASGLVEEVINSGFKVMSWGAENLREEGIVSQIKTGVSGFVTDDIGLTRLLIAKFVNSDTPQE